MYRTKVSNKIAPQGLERLDPARYLVGEDVEAEDGVLVRSANLLDYSFPKSLLAIARAGVGVNNIPLNRCSEQGVAVFSTPGANANAVKELVLCAMLISSRDVTGAVRWVKNQAASGVDLETVVEKGKAAFVGPELYRKALGVIGLGAIGALVANVALDLGMDVYGYDPFLEGSGQLQTGCPDRTGKAARKRAEPSANPGYCPAASDRGAWNRRYSTDSRNSYIEFPNLQDSLESAAGL